MSSFVLEFLKDQCIEMLEDINKINKTNRKIDFPDDVEKLTSLKDQLLEEVSKLNFGNGIEYVINKKISPMKK